MTERKTKDELTKLTFEEAIGQLKEIVGKIEQGEIPLQDSLEQYEKGMALIKHCRGILQKHGTLAFILVHLADSQHGRDRIEQATHAGAFQGVHLMLQGSLYQWPVFILFQLRQGHDICDVDGELSFSESFL